MKYLAKLNWLAQEIGLQDVTKQVHQINELTTILGDQRIPKKHLADIGFLPDKLERLCEQAPTKELEIKVINQLLNNLRNYLAQEFGLWSIPNLTTAELIAMKYHLHDGLEIMAGNAQWTKAFQDVGVNMVATDDLSWSVTSATGARNFAPVTRLTAIEALIRYATVADFVILAWAPNFGDADISLLEAYRNLPRKPLLLMVGERGGATNSTAFWRTAKVSTISAAINRSFKSFDFINEKILKVE